MSLTADQIAIIKSTAPIIKQHGTAVTGLFYNNMLEENPQLKNYFSLRNQQTGAQQTALANAVLGAATYIDDLGKISAVVERIAQKHASLFVKAEHYPIVGRYLIGAFGDTLGDAFTPEIKDAWVTAYGILADIFIGREKQLYDEMGSWQDWKNFTIVRKETEADGIVSFYLKPSDGCTLPKFLPGQYVSVQIPIPELDGLYQSRQFSLSLAPHEGLDHYRITVKKEEQEQKPTLEDLATGKVAGLVSQRLHEQYKVGSEVQLSPPHGEFVFDPATIPSTAPVVLLSIGVGATPLISILDTILTTPGQSSRPVAWIHGARNSSSICYGKYVREAAAQHANITTKIFLKDVQVTDKQGHHHDYEGRFHLDTLTQDKTLPLDDASAEYFICGPEEWMVDIRAELQKKGVSLERMHLELFRTGNV